MFSRTGSFILGVLALAAVTLSTPRSARSDPPLVGPPAPKPKPATTDEPSINLFLDSPRDLNDLLERLKHPDFLLIKEGEYRKRLDEARGASGREAPAAASVTSVAVQGEVKGDLAHLVIEFGVVLATPGPTSVPIRLDDQNLTDAREGDRPLPAKSDPGKGWEVELTGAGRHTVRVRLTVRLKTAADGARIDLAIPETPSTRFELDVPQRVVDAVAGTREPVEVESIDGGPRSRLSQILTARPRLDVSWRVETEPGVQLPPLLSIQGEIAIDVDPGSFRTRSTWMVYAVRGVERTLELRIDPDDELLELELDGQPPPAGIERVDGSSRLTINLIEPLRPGAPRKLVMATRRPLPTAPAARVSFAGFALRNAKEQSGAIGIARTGNLWIQPTAGRGLLQIDPRELPADLRVRPATTLAYQFVDQPFDLSLRIEPSPPLVSTRSRTRVSLGASRARVDTWLDYQAARGRLFEATLALPRRLDLESVGPADTVESYKVGAETSDGTRLLSVLLSPKARERSSFSIHVTGTEPIDVSKPVAVDLFQPRGTTTGGGRISVAAERSLAVERLDPEERSGAPEEFRTAPKDPPADWPWPSDRASAGANTSEPVALWLRHDGNPASLPLRVTAHPLTVTHQSSLLVQVTRGHIEVGQETRCAVLFGALNYLDVLVPAVLQDRWEVESEDVSGRSDLGTVESGDRLYRLRLAREITGKVRMKFRFRLPLNPALEPERPTELSVPWVRVRQGTAEALEATLASESGIDLAQAGSGWERSEVFEAASEGEAGPVERFSLTAVDPATATLRVVATARPVATLPALVASRLWLRTIQGPEGQVRASAWYRVEAHDGALAVALPPGAEWVRARVGGELLGQVEPLPKSGGYRLRLPARSTRGPVVVELEYTISAGTGGSASASTWAPPRLLEGGLVEETLWEVRLPSSRAVLGIPRGWSDENQWIWDRTGWKRRPWRNASALAAWVSGTSARPPASDALDGEGLSDYQSFLFGRTGPPEVMELSVASRLWLLALCSGTVLVVGGFFLLVWQPPFRLFWIALTALGIVVAAASVPSVTLVLLQSGALGAVLVVVTALLQRVIGRRWPAHSHGPFVEPNRLVPGTTAGSSLNRASSVGSDDSTAIRVRSASTVDYVVSAPVPPPAESTSSRTPSPKSG